MLKRARRTHVCVDAVNKHIPPSRDVLQRSYHHLTDPIRSKPTAMFRDFASQTYFMKPTE
jgi:hypothetical protein